MPNYYRKPVGIDAWRWGLSNFTTVMPEWLRTAIEADRIMVHHGPPLLMTILRPIGNTYANPEDWIIREANGDLSSCQHDEFTKLYAPAITAPIITGLDPAEGRDREAIWMAPRTGELHSGLLDPFTPTCEYCGARVFDPCSAKHPGDADSVNCQLPPGTVYVDDRRKNLIGGPGFEVDAADPAHPVNRDAEFLKALTSTINSHSRENGSDTPDFILGQFLMTCLTAFDVAVSKRTKWYQGEPAIEKIVGDNVQLESALALIKEACERAGRPEGIAITDFIEQLGRECTSLNAQLVAEGEHTAAGSAEIARLNTEIERITRRQQGMLAGKD